jgi:phosphate transport system substrate-binding protein
MLADLHFVTAIPVSFELATKSLTKGAAMTKRFRVAFAASLAMMIACADTKAAELPVVGTGDGIELLRALGAAFMADHPQTNILVPPSIGSGGGVAAVGSDKEVLARIARPLSDSERALGLVATPVFRLPSAFFVHRSVGITKLTASQLAAIYAGKVTNWREVGGADLRIKVVRREEVDSTLAVLRQSMPGWKDLVITEKSKTAVTTQDCIDSVKQVEGAIGFGPFTKPLEMELSVLRIDGHYPTDPDYPSAVTLAFVHKETTVTEEARAFIAYAQTNRASTLLTSMGGVPILQ